MTFEPTVSIHTACTLYHRKVQVVRHLIKYSQLTNQNIFAPNWPSDRPDEGAIEADDDSVGSLLSAAIPILVVEIIDVVDNSLLTLPTSTGNIND